MKEQQVLLGTFQGLLKYSEKFALYVWLPYIGIVKSLNR